LLNRGRLLHRSVDVVTEPALSPYIRDSCPGRSDAAVSRDALYLRHILDAIEKIERHV
jgi:hypothetical protein